MSTKQGWAEPDFVLSEPKIQKVKGFYYFFTEQKNVTEAEASPVMHALTSPLHEAYRMSFGDVELPDLLVMFIDVAEKIYDVQVGFALTNPVSECGQAKVRRVKSTLVAGILMWGTDWSVTKSYGPLMNHYLSHGYEGGTEWREWHMYSEGQYSKNNVIWVQHDLKEKIS